VICLRKRKATEPSPKKRTAFLRGQKEWNCGDELPEEKYENWPVQKEEKRKKTPRLVVKLSKSTVGWTSRMPTQNSRAGCEGGGGPKLILTSSGNQKNSRTSWFYGGLGVPTAWFTALKKAGKRPDTPEQERRRCGGKTNSSAKKNFTAERTPKLKKGQIPNSGLGGCCQW